MSESEKNPATEPLFVNLIQSLAAGALQQLGKLVNPATGRAEANLEAARISIDLIEALERKTRGNVSDAERRMLAETLTMLRLNYVETAEAAKKTQTPASGASAPGSESAAEAPKTETAPPGEAAPKAEGPPSGEPPRFHKSYG